MRSFKLDNPGRVGSDDWRAVRALAVLMFAIDGVLILRAVFSPGIAIIAFAALVFGVGTLLMRAAYRTKAATEAGSKEERDEERKGEVARGGSEAS